MEGEEVSLSTADLEQLNEKVRKLELKIASLQSMVKKIDADAYGLCEACGSEIDVETLSSNPETIFCGQHAPQGGQSPEEPSSNPLTA